MGYGQLRLLYRGGTGPPGLGGVAGVVGLGATVLFFAPTLAPADEMLAIVEASSGLIVYPCATRIVRSSSAASGWTLKSAGPSTPAAMRSGVHPCESTGCSSAPASASNRMAPTVPLMAAPCRAVSPFLLVALTAPHPCARQNLTDSVTSSKVPGF